MRAFHGTWRLVSGRANDADGQLVMLVSDGLLQYTSSGLVAAQCVISPESPDPRMRAALGGYIAYYGTYTVDEVRCSVGHHIRCSNVPGYVGTTLMRGYELAGDRLTLFVQLADQAEVDPGVRAEMVWERVVEAA
jgi:hypothetical protein